MNRELLSFINDACEKKDLVNRLFGIRIKDGVIEGLIDPDGQDRFWLNEWTLCATHQELIHNWLDLGGSIENE